MSAFEYRALEQNGKTVSGYIEADSEKIARSKIREKGLFPSEIHLVSNDRVQSNKKGRPSIPLRLLTVMCRQLSALVLSGHTVENAIKTVAVNTKSKKVAEVLTQVRSMILDGNSFHESVKKCGLFPSLYLASIEAGESTGKLGLVLDQLSDHLESQRKLKGLVYVSLTYPLILIVVAVAITSAMLVFVVPEFKQVFDSLNQELPSSTKSLLFISEVLRSYWLYLICFILLAAWAFRYLIMLPSVKSRLHKAAMMTPFLGDVIVSADTSSFFRTTGVLISAGVPLQKALKMSVKSISLTQLKKQVEEVSLEVSRGADFSYEMSKTSFPAIALQLISSAKGVDGLSFMLIKSATTLDSEVKNKLDAATKAFEPILILLIGAVVLFIVGALMSPIFNINDVILSQ